MSARRQNPLYGRQPQMIAGIALAGGLVAALAGASPTGSTAIDAAMVTIICGAAIWAAGSAPWWIVGSVCGVAAVAATPQLLLVALGLIGLGLVGSVGARRRNQPWLRSVSAALAAQVVARLEVGWFQGWSTIIAGSLLTIVFVAGVRRRPGGVRRRAWRVVGFVAVAGFASLLGFGVSALSARAQLEEANRLVRSGLDALNRGDFESAQTKLAQAAQSLRRADDDLNAPWGQMARLVPIVAQNRAGAIEVTSKGGASLERAAIAVSKLDQDSVRVVNGRIDLAAVRAFEEPFAELRNTITELGKAVARADSPWLITAFRDRLATMATDVTKNTQRADNALASVRLAPDMLGANGPRKYFIAFTTPAEARGGGGFMGNFAEVTADQGRLTMTRFGRLNELTLGGGDGRTRTVNAAKDVAGVYGGYGFVSGSDGTASSDVWKVVTMIPDHPTVARFITELYPQSGGTEIDGVFVLDPEAIASLIGFTGPIKVEGIERSITQRNAAQFIEIDQYNVRGMAERIELLDVIAEETVERLLSSALPRPTALADAFAPLAKAHRFMAWSRHAEEQALLATVGMSGEFPQLGDGDGLVVTVDNGSANKIDAYLDVATAYHVDQPDDLGVITATASITLDNSAPSEGLPNYVIGNAFDLPAGTNRLLLSVYSALAYTGATIDGVVQPARVARVFGWNYSSIIVDVPSKQSVTVEFTFTGSLNDPSAPLVTWTQPLVREPKLTVSRG